MITTVALALLKRFWPYLLGALLMVLAVIWWNSYIGSVEQRGYDKAVSEYQIAKAEAERVAAEDTKKKLAVKDAAISEGVEREKELRRLVDSGAAANAGMRNTIGNLRIRLSGESGKACVDTGNALATVLEECVGRYFAVAEVADRHASDAKTLSEAWPE